MVRLDIIAGLKNAVARGYSIEQARTSLLNAGYSIEEINEAINYVTGGVTLRDLMPKTPENSNTSAKQEYNINDKKNQTQPQTQQIPPYQNNPNQLRDSHIEGTNYQKALERQNNKSNFPWKIILLVLVLIILIGILITFLLFKDNIIGFLESLLG